MEHQSEQGTGANEALAAMARVASRVDRLEEAQLSKNDVDRSGSSAIIAMAKQYLRLRIQRHAIMPGIFADPAWDMLLEAYVAEAEGKRLQVSDMGLLSGVAATTSLRYLKALTEAGHLSRRDDLHDGRRVFVHITPSTFRLVHNWLMALASIIQKKTE